MKKHVEKHFDDLHTDTKWSHDIMDNLKEMCLILDEPYTKPPRRIPHRWLSTFDCAETLIHMLNSLLVLYFAFMPEKCDNECSWEMYCQEYRQILVDKKVNIAGKKVWKGSVHNLRGKRWRKRVRNEKTDIWKAVGYEGYDRSHHTAVFGCFPDVQVIWISFWTKDATKTHDKLVEIFRNFLACFMKYEKIRNIRSKKLKRIKIDDSSIRDVETFFYGGKNERLMKEMCAKKETILRRDFEAP